jgi:hypothetical protein
VPDRSDGPGHLARFLEDAGPRISGLSRPALVADVAPEFRPAAASIARQAEGRWTAAVEEGAGFRMLGSMREFRLGRDFGDQCGRVIAMLAESRNPVLRAIVGRLSASAEAAMMSAFFHYFVAHEFLHVEQRLGSDHYVDSDAYMPIVAEADHVADVAGLAVVLAAPVEELAGLAPYERLVLLVAIHISAMHSFGPPGAGLDGYAFSRLLVWYLHFARVTKGGIMPDLASPPWLRPWIVTLPRLVGRADLLVSRQDLERRADQPYPAGSDLVLAYHHEDGLFRIHRTAFTDEARTLRLACAIIDARFDDVRLELEELLVGNPALVPAPSRSAPGVEWAAGSLMEAMEKVGAAARAGTDVETASIEAVRDAVDALRAALRMSGSRNQAVASLAAGMEAEAESFLVSVSRRSAERDPQVVRMQQRRLLSLVEQLVLAAC